MAERVFTQTFGVVGAIIEKDGKILLVREKTGHDRGKWNQPAGWIEVSENPIEEVIKEVKEETGLDFEPTGLVGIYSLAKSYPREGVTRHGIKLIFQGEVRGGLSPDPAEVEAAKWFTSEEIYDMGPELRDEDIKQEVKDYFSGKFYPLEIIHHTLMETYPP